VLAHADLGGRLALRDEEAIREIRDLIPTVRKTVQRRKLHLNKWFKATIAAGLAALILAGSVVVFPSLYLGFIPDDTMVSLGERYASGLAPEEHRCTGERGLSVLVQTSDEFGRLRNTPYPLKVWVVNSTFKNAFATAGGHVVLFRGLIDESENPSELIGVLAHEIGHVVEQHPEQSLVRSVGVTAVVQVLALSVGIHPDIVSGAASLAQMQYSRDAEREADAFAANLLKETGFDPMGLATILGKLTGRKVPLDDQNEAEQADEKSDAASDDERSVLRDISIMFATHPDTDERVRSIRELSEGYSPDPNSMAEDDWNAIKTVCDGDGEPVPFIELLTGLNIPDEWKNREEKKDGEKKAEPTD